jgi:hypothetical protein
MAKLFLVLNSESSFPLGFGRAIVELEQCHPAMEWLSTSLSGKPCTSR